MSKIIGVTVGTPTSPKRIADGIVDQIYNPESENAQSGKAVAEAVSDNKSVVLTKINSFAELYALVTDTAVFELGNRKLVNAIVVAPIMDKVTSTFLPTGRYLAIGSTNSDSIGCWSYGDNVLYNIQPVAYANKETGELSFSYKVTSSKDFVTDYVDDLVGDIDTALDNIIALQNSYIGGAD